MRGLYCYVRRYNLFAFIAPDWRSYLSDVWSQDAEEARACIDRYLTCRSGPSFACNACGAVLLSAHLLDLHLTEVHDPFFELQAAKRMKIYRCLVEVGHDWTLVPLEFAEDQYSTHSCLNHSLEVLTPFCQAVSRQMPGKIEAVSIAARVL